MTGFRALPRRALVAVALLALAPARALAGGVLLYETGTADVGLASAGNGARCQDAATVLNNPAGMSCLPGTRVLLGAQLLYNDTSFSVGEGTSNALGTGNGGNPVGWFPGGGAYVSWAVRPDLSIGFAAAGTFGLALAYDAGWAGRYYAQEAKLIGFSLLPSVAWKPSEAWSVGASLHAMYGSLGQKVGLNTAGEADGQLSLDDTAWGLGVNLGVLWRPAPATRVGLTWTSQVNLDFATKPTFSGLSPALEALLRARGLDTATLDLGIHVPQSVTLSGYQALDERWALLGSFGWQQWSKFGEVEAGISDVTDPTSVTKDLSFEDTWHGALGVQFQATPAWRVDGGVAYDSGFQDNASVSPMLPVNEAWRFALGVRHEASERWAWGLSAEYATGPEMQVSKASSVPVALGGRGNLQGSYSAYTAFLAAHVEWKL